MSCILKFQTRLIGVCLLMASAPLPAESAPHAEAICNSKTHYSVLQTSRPACAAATDATAQELRTATPKQYTSDAPLDPDWIQAEVLAFAVIGVAQIRGGTALLGDIWYAGAVLVPPFMETHREYGTKLNYLAITPPFIALGLMNAYLHHDRAENPRVFIANFIGFNLSLVWSQAVRSSPQNFFTKPTQLNASIYPLEDGAGIHLAYRW